MKLSAWALAGALALGSAACGTKREAAAEKPPVATGVTVEKVSLAPMEQFYEATGTVRSKTTTVLSAKIMGTVTALRAREGDRVAAGQVLIEIDNRDAAAQLQKANAGLRQAQEALPEIEQSINAAKAGQAAADANKRLADATLARYQALYERKSISPQEYDEAKSRQQVAAAEAVRAAEVLNMLAAKKQQALAQVEQARADVAAAQVAVGYGRIAAPVAGIVAQKHIEPGATAAPGMPLLTIEDGNRYRLEAAVEESQLGKIKLGEKARLRIDALGVDDLDGTVAEIVPGADPMSRSYTVKIDVPARPLLRAGLYGTARFAAGRKDAIAIPRKAVVQQGQLQSVFAVDDAGIARMRLIRTGRPDGDRIEVLAGLNAGDRIAVAGVERIKDGSRIQ